MNLTGLHIGCTLGHGGITGKNWEETQQNKKTFGNRGKYGNFAI